jgi:hypothetical protein
VGTHSNAPVRRSTLSEGGSQTSMPEVFNTKGTKATEGNEDAGERILTFRRQRVPPLG